MRGQAIRIWVWAFWVSAVLMLLHQIIHGGTAWGLQSGGEISQLLYLVMFMATIFHVLLVAVVELQRKGWRDAATYSAIEAALLVAFAVWFALDGNRLFSSVHGQGPEKMLGEIILVGMNISAWQASRRANATR